MRRSALMIGIGFLLLSLFFTVLWASDTDDAKTYYDLGYSKYEQKNYIGAIKDFNKAIELYPTIAGSYNYRGLSKYELEDYTGAIKDFNKAIELDPKVAGSYYYRGLSKDELKDYAGAITDFNKAIELKLINPMFYYSRGLSKYKLEGYTAAIKDFNKAIELDPTVAISYYCRGLAKYFQGDREGALEDLSKAGELGYSGAYEVIKKIQSQPKQEIESKQIIDITFIDLLSDPKNYIGNKIRITGYLSHRYDGYSEFIISDGKDSRSSDHYVSIGYSRLDSSSKRYIVSLPMFSQITVVGMWDVKGVRINAEKIE